MLGKVSETLVLASRPLCLKPAYDQDLKMMDSSRDKTPKDGELLDVPPALEEVQTEEGTGQEQLRRRRWPLLSTVIYVLVWVVMTGWVTSLHTSQFPRSDLTFTDTPCATAGGLQALSFIAMISDG